MSSEPVLVVVDAANVVGSVPDGWWRDRAGAAERLRDGLAAVDAAELTAGRPAELVLVVEGRAARIADAPGVRVVAAPGSGDDAIVNLVERECGGERGGEGARRECLVVTADRGLRERVAALGAQVVGPGVLRRARRGAKR